MFYFIAQFNVGSASVKTILRFVLCSVSVSGFSQFKRYDTDLKNRRNDKIRKFSFFSCGNLKMRIRWNIWFFRCLLSLMLLWMDFFFRVKRKAKKSIHRFVFFFRASYLKHFVYFIWIVTIVLNWLESILFILWRKKTIELKWSWEKNQVNSKFRHKWLFIRINRRN